MNRGKLIALDTPARLRSEAREPVLQVRVPDAAAAVEKLHDAPGVLEAALFGRDLHVTVRDVEEAGAVIPARLAREGIAVLGMERIAPSLEDVFVSQVRAAGGAPVD